MNYDPSQWPVLSRLLDEILEQPPEARERWINELPPDLGPLQAALRHFLSIHAAAETADFLGKGPDLSAAFRALGTEAVDWKAGDPVGPYVLEAQVGRGGMGTVWRASRADGALKRPVALKLPFAGLFGAELGRRLLQERDILASLTHSGIARLYDAGSTSAGQPYIALEYVEGVPLTEFCDRERLSARERLEVFLQVLAAVQFAHTHLVVHRDLKPSNVLVTSDRRVSLLDFGIAKLLAGDSTQSSPQTQLGLQVLTPDYASPEQFLGGPITTASDVYSAGVLLFELLTAHRPYAVAGESRADLELAVIRSDPMKPSQVVVDEATAAARGTTPRALSHALRGDLDTIVLKALKKLPQDRYATAASFAQDIERFLRQQPIAARPDHWSYRVRKFTLRHRLAVAATIVAVLGMLATTLVAVRQRQVARSERDRAEALLSRNESVTDFLNVLITEAAQADKPVTVTDMLGRSEALAEHDFRDNPANYAAVLDLLGTHYHAIGEDSRAEPLYRKALAAAQRSGDPALVAQLRCDQAMTLAASGHAEEGTRTLQDVVASPHTSDAQAARCLQYLSYIAQDAADAAPALAYANAALIRLHRAPREPGKQEGEFLGSLAYSEHLNGDSARAQQHFEQAMASFSAQGQEHSPDAIAVLNNWAVLSNDTGNPGRALALYEDMIKSSAAMGAGSPPVYLLANRARSLELVGRYADARAAYVECVRAATDLSQRVHAYCEIGLASTAQELGDLSEAKRRLESATVLMGPASPDSPSASGLQLIRGRVALAENHLEEARQATSASIGTQIPISLSTASLIDRSAIGLHENRLDEAEADARAALNGARSLQGGLPFSSRTGLAYLALAEVLEAKGNGSEAKEAYESAIQQLTATVDPVHPALSEAQQHLATLRE